MQQAEADVIKMPVDSGPPKVRTDAERAADAAAKSGRERDLSETSPNLKVVPKPEAPAKKDVKPAVRVEPTPEPKTETKPEPKTAAKPEPKPTSSTESKPEPTKESKSEGRLLPWDDSAPKPVEPPKAPSPAADNPPSD